MSLNNHTAPCELADMMELDDTEASVQWFSTNSYHYSHLVTRKQRYPYIELELHSVENITLIHFYGIVRQIPEHYDIFNYRFPLTPPLVCQ